MTGWAEFALALAVFFATHFLPTRQGLRARLIGWMGRRLYFSIYGIVSLLVVVWLISAAIRAPYVELWWQAGWHRWVPVLTMSVAILLAVLGVGVAYPHTLGGRRSAGFDPARPGIAAVTRHPLLWAMGLWSCAHLVANGTLALVILFGGFAALSFGAMAIFDRRARTALPAPDWEQVRRRTSILSLRPLGDTAWWRVNRRPLLRGAGVAVLVYLLVFALHEPVIGVSPEPA